MFTSVQKNKQYFSRRVVAARYVMIAAGVTRLLRKKAVKVLEGYKRWHDMGTEVTELMWIA